MTPATVVDPAAPILLAVARSDSDVIELPTVGIDVGSATFHLAVSRVRLERRAQELSSRYEVVAREVLLESPVMLTPYLDTEAIDVVRVEEAVQAAYDRAGVDPSAIESGVVLLTGRALARRNARALAERLAGDSGRFVCAAAGHQFEAVLAAHGSGAVERSAAGVSVVAMDVGGATTKLALAEHGRVVSTAALTAGGRLLAWNDEGRLVRVEAPIQRLGSALGITLRTGDVVDREAVDALCDHMARAVVSQLTAGSAGSIRLTTGSKQTGEAEVPSLLLTAPFPAPEAEFEIVASGGVAEYFNARPDTVSLYVGDLGPQLAEALVDHLQRTGMADRLRPGTEAIRATVIGAAQFSTQVSGSTIRVEGRRVLPLHDVPVVRPELYLGTRVDSGEVAAAIRSALALRVDGVAAHRAIAVAVQWEGRPEHARLRALADGIRDAVDGVLDGRLLAVVIDNDIAASLGRIMVEESGMGARELVVLDNLDLGEFDHIDLGCPSRPANVVPVVVKSLLFDASTADGALIERDEGGSQ